jgi:cytochrome c peroxidase
MSQQWVFTLEYIVRMKIASLSTFLACTIFFMGCNSGGSGDSDLVDVILDHNVLPVAPPNQDPAMVQLGQALFFDKILSGNRDISCAACHHPTLSTTNGISLSVGTGGVGLGASRSVPLDGLGNPIFIPRNAPEIFNRGNFSTMFWDARVEMDRDGNLFTPAGADLLAGLIDPLAAQAMFPVTSRAEMRGGVGESELGDLGENDFVGIWTALMARLLAIPEYQTLFAAAFPGVAEIDLSFAHAANAIAAFEIQQWTLPESPFDRYVMGEYDALTNEQKSGARLFFGRAGCVACHSGPNLTDESFHNTGVPQLGPGKGDGADGSADFGRERVSGDPADRYRFRTPSLRNVSMTGPWTHAGAFTNLTDVIARYADIPASARNYDPSQLEVLLQPFYRPEET